MRDLVLLLVFSGLALSALRWPWVGAVSWTWISTMNPHAEFGYASASWPVGAAIVGCTLLGLLFTRDRQNPMVGAPTWWMLAFAVWTCVTLPFSFYFDESQPLWIRSMKIWFMLFVTMALINSRAKLDVLVWVTVGSLAFFGVKGGAFTLATGGNFRVWGPGGFIEGNNELALALVMTVPLMRYLQLQMTNRWARYAMFGAMGLTAVAILGSHSRGAFLAIAAMAFMLWLKGRNKFGFGVLLVVLAVLALPFMPEAWWERMATIRTYEEDASAMGRINAWWTAWNLAGDRLLGGGFMIYKPSVFAIYAPDPNAIHAAHSIYFQVLGEHGFIGLFLFMAIGASTWLVCRRLIWAAAVRQQDRWAGELGAMVQVSMVGYAVGGAFLSLAYFDLPYNMMMLVVLAQRLVCRPRTSDQPAAAGATA